MDLGSLKLEFEDYSVEEIIQDLQSLVDLHIKNHGLKSIYKIEKNLPLVHVDKSRLIQVLSNLINNAVKFTERGSIRVDVFQDSSYVHFAVTDTGLGIPKSEHKKIFARFYQVDSSYTRKVGGSGLGLAISKALINNMGGKIWVKSKVGKGTRFEFTVRKSKTKKI